MNIVRRSESSSAIRNFDHVAAYVDDRPNEGVFRVHKDVFSDPELFDLEMKYVIERSWGFLALESQLTKPHDFVTAHIGRTPVLITRDRTNQLNAFLNVCRHKGARVCRVQEGNSKAHVCPYHGWAYDAAGKNISIKDHATGSYPESFHSEDHNLARLPRLESYKGLIFGSLSADVPALADYLGDARVFLDMVMDQGPNGMEFVPGRATYTYRGNWKLQLDNGLDAYHITSAHLSFMEVQARRRTGAGHVEARQFDWTKQTELRAGMFTFPYGHSALWWDQAEPEKRVLFPALDELRQRLGPGRADWMMRMRIASFFPNMQIADAVAPILRVFRPLSVDRTEMRTYCLAPIGEPSELRAWRLRQFEDFFNPGGLATPDDNVVYEDCQRGFGSDGYTWLQGYARGMTLIQNGSDAIASELGMTPATSSLFTWKTHTEGALHAAYREWARLMKPALADESADA